MTIHWRLVKVDFFSFKKFSVRANAQNVARCRKQKLMSYIHARISFPG